MGEILGIGCSHGPGISGPAETLTEIYLKLNLTSDLTPAHMKDPRNWPPKMREEWADDEGLTFSKAYQAKLQPAYREARAAIDAFNPDFVVIFGDDQYEVFQEELLPPFAIFAIDQVDCSGSRGTAPFTMKGHREAGNHLTRELIGAGFDVACSWKLGNREDYGHAFTTTIRYLDLDQRGFPHRVVPFAVNCYGADMRIPGYGRAPIRGRILDDDSGDPPPPSPPPWRCYDLGKEVARIIAESPWRAVVVGSSSWSHGSLTPRNHFLYPDVEADHKRLAELEAGEQWKWRNLTHEEIRDAGQHEILNWICLAGAMEGRRADILAFADCYITNSEKCVALFRP